MFPIFRSTPTLVVGIPVAWAIFCFACVIPKALANAFMNMSSQMFNMSLTTLHPNGTKQR